jgi:hypothetical protein
VLLGVALCALGGSTLHAAPTPTGRLHRGRVEEVESERVRVLIEVRVEAVGEGFGRQARLGCIRVKRVHRVVR